jgi:hypothetical protein
MLFVWAQFELQVGIMCASAPALRVFFRHYLGGNSQHSNSDSQIDEADKSGTVIHENDVENAKGGAATRSTEKQQSHEMRDLVTPFSEDGDGLSRSSETLERDLTRYSHETDHVGSNAARSSWFGTTEKQLWKVGKGH